MRIKVAAALGLVLVAAACASKAPAPIMPEPVYDKYGNAIVDTPQCRDGGQSYAENSPYARLPICENTCQPGYTVAADFQQCVPGRDGGDKEPDPQRPTVGN